MLLNSFASSVTSTPSLMVTRVERSPAAIAFTPSCRSFNGRATVRAIM